LIDPFLVSYVALWVVVLAEGLLLAGALRHVGQLWLRVGPELPLDYQTDLQNGTSLDAPWVPRMPGRESLVLFVSPTCAVCAEVLTDLAALIPRNQQISFVGDADADGLAEYSRKYGLAQFRWVADPDRSLSESIGIHDVPFALLLDRHGTVQRTAIVNSARQLESMIASTVGEAA